MDLVDRILAGGAGILKNEYDMVYFKGDDLFAATRPRGLPIGNLTSQFWANVYLNELDQYVKRRRVPCLPALCGRFPAVLGHKRELWEWKAATWQRSSRNCDLTLHERESTVYPVANGIPFLGFRVYPTHRLLKRRNALAFQRRLRSWSRAMARGDMKLDDIHPRVRGWIAHARHGDTSGLRRALLPRPSAAPGHERVADLCSHLRSAAVADPGHAQVSAPAPFRDGGGGAAHTD